MNENPNKEEKSYKSEKFNKKEKRGKLLIKFSDYIGAFLLGFLVGYFTLLQSVNKVHNDRINEIRKEPSPLSKDLRELKQQIDTTFEIQNTVVNNSSISLVISEFHSPVLFEFNKATFKEEYQRKLGNIIRHIKSNIRIEVRGHTDNKGKDWYNYDLSKRRAESVANFLNPLMDKGNVQVMGFGEDIPVVANDDENGRRLNRRVELVFFDKFDESTEHLTIFGGGKRESVEEPFFNWLARIAGFIGVLFFTIPRTLYWFFVERRRNNP